MPRTPPYRTIPISTFRWQMLPSLKLYFSRTASCHASIKLSPSRVLDETPNTCLALSLPLGIVIGVRAPPGTPGAPERQITFLDMSDLRERSDGHVVRDNLWREVLF